MKGVSTSALLVFIVSYFCLATATNLLIVVLSQQNSYYAQRAQMFKRRVEEQISGNRSLPEPTVLLLHEAWPDVVGAWTIFPILDQLASRMEKSPPNIDFSIDIQHEFALYVWDSGSGTPLTIVPFLCGFNGNPETCATVRLSKFPKCNQRTVNRNEVTFAVKTCEKYHLDRLTVVKKTWGKETENIEFFSDVSDPSIPTVTLGIPNTERGHCRKFMAILQHTYNELKTHKYQWIVIADDDTLISIPRLGKFLSCFDSNEVVILGERYGYGVVKGNGYDYITLGGGMVLSRIALQHLIDNESCRCASDDAPDDMTLGLCLKHVGIAVTHSPLFHQARPNDYSELYLANQDPVTFHKHWNVNPYEVYNKYLDVVSTSDDAVRDEL